MLLATCLPMSALAQSTFWLQVEAQPSLREGQERARAYAGAFDNVNGFSLGSGWYAITMGPFSREDAEKLRRELRFENLIPRDAYIVDGSRYRQQFWPIGANSRSAAAVPLEPQAGEGNTIVLNVPQAEPEAEETAPVIAVIPDETPTEARRSEARLSREEKRELQTALQWEGHYTAAIDGSFGAGTRRAMEAYQSAEGLEVTGILTTAQRATLVETYKSQLAELGLTRVIDDTALIEIDLPLGLVALDRYQAPFAHYTATDGESPITALLISEPGTPETLAGLFDVMQTLDIVPLSGERKLSRNAFTIEGEGAEIRSYTHVRHEDGLLKGFTLVWPTGDDKRYARVVEAMKSSFTPFGNRAMPQSLGLSREDQQVDLLAGLEIRKPSRARSGFYIDAEGTVLTTAEAVAACEQVTLDESLLASVSFTDEVLGIAVLKPEERLAPIAYADFSALPPRLRSEVAVAGYSYEGLLGAPTLTFGTLDDLKGLQGEASQQRLALAALPGDIGGPVFDAGGAVVGILLPQPEAGGRQLPEGVAFSASASAISEALTAKGLRPRTASGVEGQMHPEDLSGLAADMTVLVSCWN
ncbi:trypsin-like peptidase domain-containing protein [Pseudoruegeria sp. SHC-113]|nr:trypsin-like peptidase domain-containing protein [Pseudoruegeria sp. SHC-113]